MIKQVSISIFICCLALVCVGCPAEGNDKEPQVTLPVLTGSTSKPVDFGNSKPEAAIDQAAIVPPSVISQNQDFLHQALEMGHPNAWVKLARRAESAISESARNYTTAHGRVPASTQELAQFAFLWPVCGPMQDAPARFEAPESLLLSPGEAAQDYHANRLRVGLEVRDGQLLMVAADAETSDSGLIYTQHTWKIAPLSGGPRQNARVHNQPKRAVSTDWYSLEDSVELVWSKVFSTNVIRGARPEDARIATLKWQLSLMLSGATAALGRLPISEAELTHATAMAVCNVEHVDPDQAQVLLTTDGKSGYRLRVRYPSGVVEDTWIDPTDVTPGAGILTERAFTGADPMLNDHLVVALRVVPVSLASFPGLPASPTS